MQSFCDTCGGEARTQHTGDTKYDLGSRNSVDAVEPFSITSSLGE